MFEDILASKYCNIAQLSKASGVGYNYVFKIVKNQTDFGRCGIDTASKLAHALDMDLNDVYSYKEQYYESKIYYQDQTGWDYQMYGILNSELNKLFQIGIEYHFSSDQKSRDNGICKKADMEISCINFDKLTEKTKCIMVAILNQQKLLKSFVEKYVNLKPLLNQKPLTDTLYLSRNPYNIFTAYREMNIEY